MLFTLPPSFSPLQQGCTACFTEKQRDWSILMPLGQSICRPYFPKAVGQNQTTCPQIFPFLFFFPETLTSCPLVQIFPPRLIPSLLLLIQSLEFIFYKILSVLYTMMTISGVFREGEIVPCPPPFGLPVMHKYLRKVRKIVSCPPIWNLGRKCGQKNGLILSEDLFFSFFGLHLN